MKGLYYNIFRLQKVCKEYHKSVFLKLNYIKKKKSKHGKYS